MPPDERSRRVREIINDFAYRLMHIDPNSPDLEQIVTTSFSNYHTDLINAGCTGNEARGFMTANFLAMQTDAIKMTPSNHDEIATVLVKQLTAEAMIRKYLSLRAPGLNWYSQDLNFAAVIDLCKDLLPEDKRKKFRAALKEFGRIRNYYAHRPDYRLKEEDVPCMEKFLDLYKKHYAGYGKMPSLEIYTEFADLVFAYFHGMYWTTLTGEVPEFPDKEY